MKTLSLLSVLLCITLVGCTPKKDAAEKFFQSGRQYYENNQMEKARIEFLNAMQNDPQRSDTYYYLGLIAKQEGDFPLVLENMNLAMVLDKNNHDAKVNVAELHIFNSDFERADTLADEILAIAPEYFDALRIKAAVKIGQERYDEAKTLLQQALVIEPRDATVHALNASIEEKQGNLEVAIQHLDVAIESSQDKVQYLLFRSNLHRELNNYQELERDLRALIKEKPRQESFILSLSEMLFEQGQERKAMLFLRQFIRNNPDKTNIAIYYVRKLAIDDEDRAKQTLRTMIEKQPSAADLQFFRVRWLLQEGQGNEAKKSLKATAKNSHVAQADQLDANAMLAEILMKQGERDEAIERIEFNLNADAQHEKSLLLNAQNMLDGQHYDYAVASLRTVLRNNPTSEPGLLMLGKVYTQSGSALLADDAYRQALNINPANVGAAIPVVNGLLASQDLERSDNILMAALSRRPNDQELQIFLAQIKVLKKDWQGLATLAESLKIQGNLSYSLLFQGRLHQGLKQFDRAIDAYRQSLLTDHSLIPALQGLAASYVALSKEQEFLSYLQDYRQAHPDTIVAYSVAAAVHKQLGETRESVSLLRQALNVQPTWVKGYAILAGQLNELGDTSAAVDVYKAGIDRNNNDTSLRILLATYYESIGDLAQSANLYQQIMTEDPENLLVLNNYVVLLLDNIATEESQQKALRLSEGLRHSSEPFFMDTVGWSLVKNGQYVEGERYLRLASDNADSIPEIKYHLAIALKNMGRKEEAKQWLKRAAVLSGNNHVLLKDIEIALASL